MRFQLLGLNVYVGREFYVDINKYTHCLLLRPLEDNLQTHTGRIVYGN